MSLEGGGERLSEAGRAALEFLERGYQPVPIPYGLKGPRTKKWPLEQISVADVPRLFGPRSNIGAKLGSVSRGLTDVDLDAPEAVALGNLWLPQTGMRHGRPGKPRSHKFYISDGARTRKYLDPALSPEEADKATLLEIRAENEDRVPVQTLVPPSVNAESADPPEKLEWEEFGEPLELTPQDLYSVASMVAAGSLVLRYWKNGMRHDSSLPLAGALLLNGWPEERAVQFMDGISAVAGADRAKVRRVVHDTAERHRNGEKITGIPTLKHFMPAPVVDRIHEWLGLGSPGAAAVVSQATVSAQLEILTDLSSARLFVSQHGEKIRYDFDAKGWKIYDGRRWARDSCGEVERLAKRTVESLFAIAGQEPDEDRRNKIRGFALRSQDGRRIESLLKLARSEPEVATTGAAFDLDPWLFNCQNGTIDLHTGVLHPHNRADMLTKLAPVDLDPDAVSPLWDRFLERIMAGNAELAAFLQRAAGYSLTGDTSEQKLFISYGGGANGKSTFIRTIQALIGDYAVSTPIDTLIVKHGSGASNELARLRNTRFVSSIEAEDGQRFAEEKVKHMTGGDVIAARFLYQEHFEFRPTFKIWLATNHRPHVRGTDEAIWRRIDLIPFTVSIPEDERDGRLPEKLLAEAPGILAWLVAGCLRWQKQGLREPPEVLAATADYRREEDVLGEFIEDCCSTAPNAFAAAAELYAAYSGWCARSGEKTPLSQKKFGTKLRERNLESDRDSLTNRKIWRGIELTPAGAA